MKHLQVSRYELEAKLELLTEVSNNQRLERYRVTEGRQGVFHTSGIHKEDMSNVKTSQEMSAERNNVGEFTSLLSPIFQILH